LIAALEQYLAIYNRNPTPFVWTAKASDILTKVKRARKKLKPRLNTHWIMANYTSLLSQ